MVRAYLSLTLQAAKKGPLFQYLMGILGPGVRA